MTSPPITEPNRLGVYTGETTNWPAVAASIISVVPIVGLGMQSKAAWSDVGFVVPIGLIAAIMVVLVFTSTSLRATAGPNGLAVHWGLVGWPRCTYRLDDIDHAEAVDLPWWRVAYSLWWTPRRTSHTVRSGRSVRLRLLTGRLITVTVPDPDTAVAALHDASHGRTS